MVHLLTLIAGAFVLSGLLVELLLRVVARDGWLAVPNARSSHVNPTPTMGGAAFVVVVLAWLTWAATQAAGPVPQALGWLGAALGAMALMGLLDDLHHLPRRVRLGVQTAAALGVLVTLETLELSVTAGLPGLAPGGALGWLMAALLVLPGIVWFVNLFNFMDGIDGIAAMQCFGYCVGVQIVAGGIAGWPGALLWVSAASTLAFLCFNWAPAKIFMGDVGSAFLGLLIAFAALYLAYADIVPLTASLILLAVFWVDATWTLAVRVLTGQRFTEAHRSHLYQILAHKYGHARTTAGFTICLAAWLVPLALLNVAYPAAGIVWLIVSAIPIGVLCARCRAGSVVY